MITSADILILLLLALLIDLAHQSRVVNVMWDIVLGLLGLAAFTVGFISKLKDKEQATGVLIAAWLGLFVFLCSLDNILFPR